MTRFGSVPQAAATSSRLALATKATQKKTQRKQKDQQNKKAERGAGRGKRGRDKGRQKDGARRREGARERGRERERGGRGNGTSPEEESLAARRAHACGSRKPTREPPRAGNQSPPPRKMLYNMTDGPRPDHSSDPQGDCALLVVPLQTWRGYPPLCDTRTRSGGTSRSE